MSEKNTISPGKAYLKKLLFAAPVMAAACITLIFFGAFESLAFAGNAMRYDHRDVWLPLALLSLAVFALGTGLLPFLKGRLFRYSITTVFALTLSGYLQSLLMNGSMGLLDGSGFQLQAGAAVFNTIIWLSLFLVCYAVQQLSRKWWRGVLRFGSLLLSVMQLASVVSIAMGNFEGSTQMDQIYLTESGMYSYSSNKNIYVFVLDRLDYTYIEKVLREDPDFLEPLDGFTSYTNAISAYGRTQPALNHLLTGSELAYTCTEAEFYDRSWHDGDKQLLEDMESLGYTTEMYSNMGYLFSNADFALKYVKNASPTAILNKAAVMPRLLRLSALRWAPLVCKNALWADTNYFNDGVLIANKAPVYDFDDPYYAPGFLEATADRSAGSFKVYHFDGSHAPYTMNADGTASEETTNVTAQTMGSFRNLFRAFERMKELGIYEDATIIITADHGYAYKDSQPLQQEVTIGLFYKPSGSAGAPLTYSSAPVCTDNLCATLVKEAGLTDYSAYGPALDDIAEDADIVRYYYKSVCETETWHEVSVYRYEVRGDARNFDNWVLVEILDPLPAENRFY